MSEYVVSRSASLNGCIYCNGKRVSYGYPYIVISIIEGQEMIDITWTCYPLDSTSHKTPVMNAMNTFSA
jgi:hypothetical protein